MTQDEDDATVFDRHRSLLFTLAYELLGSVADAEDMVQEAYLRWSDAEGNKKFFSGEWQAFNAKAADVLLEIGLIKAKPDFASLIDTRFVASK